MIIDIRDIGFEKRRFTGDEPASIIGLEDENVKVDSPVRYDLQVYVVSNELLIEGTLSTGVLFRCSRCAEYFRHNAVVRDFRRVRDAGAEIEYVDLTGDIREAIILSFPNYPVCREGCRGLCSMCGRNLNDGGCDCGPPAENRWEALDGLNIG